jgi:hypothetical protein
VETASYSLSPKCSLIGLTPVLIPGRFSNGLEEHHRASGRDPAVNGSQWRQGLPG